MVDLRSDLGFDDYTLQDMYAPILLRWKASVPCSIYIDEIRLIKMSEPDPVDKTVLYSKIEEAAELLENTPIGDLPGHIPAGSSARNNLVTALASAQFVYDDPNSTQYHVDVSYSFLNLAITFFRNAIIAGPDKTALNTAIATADNLLSTTGRGIYKGQAPVHAHAALQEVWDEAVPVRDNPYATEAEVNAAAAALEQG